MVVDSSALIAVLLVEPTAIRITRLLEASELCLLSAANLVEASIVIEGRKRDAAAHDLDLLIFRSGIEIVPVDEDQAQIARQAWRRFGKSRHAAALNFGDCFAYALAKSRDLPLLCVGNDFSQTDIATVPLA